MRESAAWYELRAEGLGLRFVDEVASAFARIDSAALSCAPWARPGLPAGVRRVFLRSFPYFVVFVLTPRRCCWLSRSRTRASGPGTGSSGYQDDSFLTDFSPTRPRLRSGHASNRTCSPVSVGARPMQSFAAKLLGLPSPSKWVWFRSTTDMAKQARCCRMDNSKYHRRCAFPTRACASQGGRCASGASGFISRFHALASTSRAIWAPR